MYDIGTWDGQSEAFGINDNGEVVGHAQIDGLHWRGFIWLPAANPLYSAFGFTAGLNELSGTSVARDINASGHITGTLLGSPPTPFFWKPQACAGFSAGLTDLGEFYSGETEGLGLSDTTTRCASWGGATANIPSAPR